MQSENEQWHSTDNNGVSCWHDESLRCDILCENSLTCEPQVADDARVTLTSSDLALKTFLHQMSLITGFHCRTMDWPPQRLIGSYYFPDVTADITGFEWIGGSLIMLLIMLQLTTVTSVTCSKLTVEDKTWFEICVSAMWEICSDHQN